MIIFKQDNIRMTIVISNIRIIIDVQLVLHCCWHSIIFTPENVYQTFQNAALAYFRLFGV